MIQSGGETKGSQMMLVSFAKHFNIRLGEWYASLVLLSLGLLLFIATTMFARTPNYFAGLMELGPQPAWGCIFTGVGIVRVTALYVNGRQPITPTIRMLLAFVSCFVWWQVTIGLLASGVPGFGWVLFPWLLALDMYNVFRSSADAREVFDRKRAARTNETGTA